MTKYGLHFKCTYLIKFYFLNVKANRNKLKATWAPEAGSLLH